MMITSSSQVRGRSILVGYFAAVGVYSATRMPTGTKATLMFRSNKLLEINDVVPKLGIVPSGQLHIHIRDLI